MEDQARRHEARYEPAHRRATQPRHTRCEARGGFRELKLEGEGRAKVVIGDVSVLVQLVDRPPARSKPQLPSSLKRGLMGGTDWTFSSFVAASFLLHFALVVFVVEADWPVERQLIPSRHVEWIIAPPPPPDDAPTIADAEDPVADAAPEVADDLPSEPTETVDRPRHAPVSPPQLSP